MELDSVGAGSGVGAFPCSHGDEGLGSLLSEPKERVRPAPTQTGRLAGLQQRLRAPDTVNTNALDLHAQSITPKTVPASHGNQVSSENPQVEGVTRKSATADNAEDSS